MHKLTLLGLILIGGAVTLASAQPAWVRHYSSGLGVSWDRPFATAVDDQENVYVTGISLHSGTSLDIVTIKYSADGVQQWLATFHGQSSIDDVPVDIIVDQNHNVHVAGTSEGSNRNADIVVIKYDPNGQVIWSARYDTPESRYEEASAFTLDAAGNVYVTGFSGVYRQRDTEDYLTVKLNASGQFQWAHRYNGPTNLHDEATDIGIDASDNVYVTGKSASDYATLKYSASGVLLWSRRFDGPGDQYGTRDDGARALVVDGGGNVYVTGYSIGANTGYDFVTLKYDANGNEKWAVRNEIAYSERPSAIALSPSGNLVVAGRSSENYITLQYDVNGNRLWEAPYPGHGASDEVAYLKVDTDGNIYVSGHSRPDGFLAIKYDPSGVLQQTILSKPDTLHNFQTGFTIDQHKNIIFIGEHGIENDSDYLTIKIGPDGEEQWRATYDDPGISSNRAVDLAIDANNHLIVTGKSQGDAATIKYDANGNELWIVRQPGHRVTKVVADKLGSIYTTGSLAGDNVTFKYNNNGVQQWMATNDDPQQFSDVPVALAVDASANVYVAVINSVFFSQAKWVVIKYTDQGVRLWEATYSGEGLSAYDPLSLAVDDSGNVYLAGTTSSASGPDFTLLKYSTSGELLWKASYSSAESFSNDQVSAITIERRNNRNFIYVTGRSEQQITTIKYNAGGTREWVAQYLSPSNIDAEPKAITLDQQGNVYVAGQEGWESAADYLLIKYDNGGAQQWATKYNGTGNDYDYPTAIGVDPYGQVYVTGVSNGGSQSSDFVTLLYSPGGQLLWTDRYNGPADTYEEPVALGFDALGNIYVTGESSNTHNFDWSRYTTIKYNASKPVVVDHLLHVPAEYPTIQQGLNAASAGDTVLVAPGIYKESIDIVKGIVLLSEQGADYTVIDGTGKNKAQVVLATHHGCVLSGFTIRSQDSFTFGIDCGSFSPRIENCIIENMSYSGVICKNSSPTIRYNLIKGSQQAGIIMNTSAMPQIINNTIVNNRDGIVVFVNSNPVIKNNIIANNAGPGIESQSGSRTTNSYNDLWGNSRNYGGASVKGVGEISASPLFIGGNPSNYHLQANSPCVNAGDPASPTDPDGTRADMGAFYFDIGTVGVTENFQLPTTYFLGQNYPNPFNPETAIRFQLPQATHVVLKIYNLLGEEIRTLMDADCEAGRHSLHWDGKDNQGQAIASGVYLYRLQAGSFMKTKKMNLLR